MGSDGQEKHDELVRDLEGRVRHKYTLTAREVPVRDPESGRLVGEIDLLGIVGDEWHIYEVKVGKKRLTAKRQLQKLRSYLEDCGRLTLYYYSGRTDKLMEIE